jgi:hypothetical protein
MLVSTTIILGLAALVLCGVRLQQTSREMTNAMAAAIAEVERLRILPSGHVDRALNKAEDPDDWHARVIEPGLTVRWRILSGPVGTQDVTVRAVPGDPTLQPGAVRILLSP